MKAIERNNERSGETTEIKQASKRVKDRKNFN